MLLGFGVLLVLAASMALVLVWTQRIRRLAKMQMDFVAGVSHELRTPVSVISSAAENLADGVVESKPQVKQYGALIRNEAQRLAAMIEQVLLFAATRNDKRQYEPRPVPVAETIDSAVADLAHLTAANGFTVEKEVAPGLPPVMADPESARPLPAKPDDQRFEVWRREDNGWPFAPSPGRDRRRERF